MASLFDDPRWGRPFGMMMFVLSAALAALVLRHAWDHPYMGLLVLVGLGAALLSRWVARRKAAAVLKSGDVDTVLARWSSSFERVPHPETMGPLMTATAFAAYGWIDRARHVLRTARRGPAWDAAVEHRLFVDSLLLTFEGHPDQALQRAAALEELPLPSGVPLFVGRVRLLRQAVGALARAFAHSGRSGDRQLLLSASNSSPLVFWAMRYGAAILAVDASDHTQALTLLAGAPPWPTESVFGRFHHEIVSEVERQSAEPAAEPAPSTEAGQDAD